MAWAQARGTATDAAPPDRLAEPKAVVDDQPDDGRRAPVAEPAGSQVVGEPPVRLELPGGAVLGVDPVATESGGTLALPETVFRAGWWEGSARLGDPYGAIVIAAHVDSFADGIGPIAELLDAHAGDVVQLGSVGLSRDYTIRRADYVLRTELAAERGEMSFTGDQRLVLITCAGPFDPQTGYLYNLVVVAEPSGPLDLGSD